MLAATALFGSFTDAADRRRPRQAPTPTSALTKLLQPRVSRTTSSARSSAPRSCSSSPAWRSAPSAARPAGWSSRCASSSATTPGSWTTPSGPTTARVVDICTKDSLRELATPGLLAVLAPVAVGFGLGVGPLAGYLAGAIAAGVLMAVFLANSGGAWDNAKKMVEDGAYGGKGSEAHAATVIGDTVGDPFKDTAGPAINPLIKVMNLVALLVAPAVVKFCVGDDKNNRGARRRRDRRLRDHRDRRDHLQAPAGLDGRRADRPRSAAGVSA